MSTTFLKVARALLLSFWIAVSLTAPLAHAQGPIGPPDPLGGCTLNNGEQGRPKVPGVLISYEVNTGGFNCYIYHFLYENMPYIMIIAIVLIVFSGVQYMSAMGNAANQTKAKERILGVLGGMLFYFMIAYILKLMANGLTL